MMMEDFIFLLWVSHFSWETAVDWYQHTNWRKIEGVLPSSRDW